MRMVVTILLILDQMAIVALQCHGIIHKCGTGFIFQIVQQACDL